MCYFNGQRVQKEELIRLRDLEKVVANYTFLNHEVINGFDFSNVAILKANPDKKDFEIVQMEWGFLPDPMGWPFIETRQDVLKVRRGYTDPRGRFIEPMNFLNALGEEMLLKGKVYRQAALERRCLMLSTGFYEWRHLFPLNKRTGVPVKTPKKIPYRITIKAKEYFFFPAVWQPWTDADTGEYIETVANLTTAANPLMEQIHNSKKRMPTILPPDLAYEWLLGNLNEKQISELGNYKTPAEEMHAYTLKKDFLSSPDPLTSFYYDDIPPLEGIAPEGQQQLF